MDALARFFSDFMKQVRYGSDILVLMQLFCHYNLTFILFKGVSVPEQPEEQERIAYTVVAFRAGVK